MSGSALARAACDLAGVCFRLHGRDAATGLDCVGVVDAALREIGREPVLPTAYTLRNLDIARFTGFAARNGMYDVHDAQAGDVLLFRLSAVQHHLAIDVGQGRFIHAHAGLRRVVLGPAEGGWQMERRWRLSIKAES